MDLYLHKREDFARGLRKRKMNELLESKRSKILGRVVEDVRALHTSKTFVEMKFFNMWYLRLAPDLTIYFLRM